MPELLRNLVASLPIIGALMLVMSANTRRAMRARQYLLPVVALAYAMVAVVVLYRFNSWFDSLVEFLISYVPVLRDWYSVEWLYIIENAVIVLGFVVVKLILKPVFAAVFNGSNFVGSRLLDRIYEFDAEYGIWFIERRFGGLRSFYRWIY